MSFNGSGTFVVNSTGQPVVTGTVISSTVFNAFTADVATGLSTAICKDGQQTCTAGVPFYAGTVSLPGITLGTDNSTGWYRIGSNNWGYAVSGTKLLDISAGQIGVSGSIATAVTSTATAGGTTTLTASSNGIQVFTGTTTQTVTLPAVSTLKLGTTYKIITDVGTSNVTVKTSGNNTLALLNNGMTVTCTSIATSGTGVASWKIQYGAASYTGSAGSSASGNQIVYAYSPTFEASATSNGPISAGKTAAITAGGDATNAYFITSTLFFGVYAGSGAPTISAAKGSLYLRSDGSATNNRMYVNTDGSTTWTAVTTVA